MNVAIVIPFRDRGNDPLRAANLQRVLTHWASFDAPVIVADDGRSGAAQFSRHAAYNHGWREAGNADVIIYTESDMLIDYAQITLAVIEAAESPGLVVPFTQYRYLSPVDSEGVRGNEITPENCTPESVIDDGRSIGAVNVVSRVSLEAIGQWDDEFEGSWYDDNAMKIAFDVAAGPTRWINGPAHHLYHLTGRRGDHLTPADKAATRANKQRLQLYRMARTPERIRALTRSPI